MKTVNSFNEVMTYIGKVRGLRKGFLTNFFPEQRKIDMWIYNECLYVIEGEETAVFLKKDDGFTYIFYCSTAKDQLFDAIAALPEDAYVFDQIVDARTDTSLLDGFKSLGFVVRKSLVRMSKINETPAKIEGASVYDATKEDIPALDKLLHEYFDKYTEQLPTIEELNEFIDSRHMIVKRSGNKIAGFIFYDQSPSTLYLRYWLVVPEFRNQGVGSELFHEYNRRGVACKRHMLWVVEDNENAIKRYEHYGYKNENMKDYVLTKNGLTVVGKILILRRLPFSNYQAAA